MLHVSVGINGLTQGRCLSQVGKKSEEQVCVCLTFKSYFRSWRETEMCQNVVSHMMYIYFDLLEMCYPTLWAVKRSLNVVVSVRFWFKFLWQCKSSLNINLLKNLNVVTLAAFLFVMLWCLKIVCFVCHNVSIHTEMQKTTLQACLWHCFTVMWNIILSDNLLTSWKYIYVSCVIIHIGILFHSCFV